MDIEFGDYTYVYFFPQLLVAILAAALHIHVYIYIRMHGCIKHGCKHMRVVLNYGA